MGYNLLLSPGVLVVLCNLLVIDLSMASVADDSLRTAVHDAVSANQRAAARIAQAYRALDTMPVDAHRYATQAVAFAEQANDALVEHKALVCLRAVEERMGLYGDMMKTALRAVQLAQGLGDPGSIALDLRDLAQAYTLNGMSEKAVEEARNSLAIMLPTRPEHEVDQARLFLVNTLLRAGQTKEAYQLAERSLEQARERKDTLQEARVGCAIGEVLIAQERFSDAVIYLARSERHLETIGTPADRSTVQRALVRAYIGLGRTDEAARALRIAEGITEGPMDWNTRTTLLDLRYALAMAEGEWRDAVGLLERIKRTSDSVLHARLDMQTVRLQMIYQLDRKEQANAELRAENAKSAERIAGTSFNNRVLVALSIVLSGLTAALFFTGRYSRRLARRMRLKNAVIKRQHDEIHAKNLELQRQNLRLAETLMSEEEKEMMIKEIHHRVKNNLQVVDSLLQIQGMDSNDPGVARVLREAQGRIRSMALVHEHIYNSANGNVGDLRSHLEKLVRNVLVAHGAHDRISVSVDTNLPAFSTETLLPLTLVVNELFTNAVKYAFPEGATGRVSIAVRPAGSGYELLFSDDGAGMGTDEGQVRHRSFGLELIRQLADQLNGEVRFLKGAGTAVSLTFNPEPTRLRVAS